MKNIYFAGSIRGGRDDAKIYSQIIEVLKSYGAVLTEHIGEDEVSFEMPDRHIHDRDMDWLASSDILIAEVTTPSLGVGYEMGRAVAMDKPVVGLFRTNDETLLSAMISGSPGVNIHEYSTVEDAAGIIEQIFEEID